MAIKVTVWNEFLHERTNERVKALYPNGMHNFIKEFLETDENIIVRTATLNGPDYLTDELLNDTDVLIWWAHMLHGDVPDELVEKIRQRVMVGRMGFIPLHSAHKSKPFQAVVGATGDLVWGDNQLEIIWNMLPSHPIAKGIPTYFHLEREEMYGEPFVIPQPDELVFTSWYENGNIFRSGLCYYRGMGKVFYFQPGHESNPIFYNEYVQQIIKNAVYWAAPVDTLVPTPECVRVYSVLDEIKNSK
jgi:trehalose utilization protein